MKRIASSAGLVKALSNGWKTKLIGVAVAGLGISSLAWAFDLPAWNRLWTFNAADHFLQTAPFDSDRDQLEIVSRASWGARPAKNPKAMIPLGEPNGVVIHHTASAAWATPKDVQNWHMDERGWSDVGYHFLIGYDATARHYRIYEARELQYQGAHAGAYQGENRNPGKIGISVIGNFHPVAKYNPGGYPAKAEEYRRQPPPEAVALLGQLIAKLKYDFPTLREVYGHNQGPFAVNPQVRACPGDGATHLVSAAVERFNPGQLPTEGALPFPVRLAGGPQHVMAVLPQENTDVIRGSRRWVASSTAEGGWDFYRLNLNGGWEFVGEDPDFDPTVTEGALSDSEFN